MKTFAQSGLILLVLAIGAAWPSAAQAAPISFTGIGTNAATGTALKASVTFDVNIATNRLVVTLTNSAMSDVLAPSDVLTGVFFDVVGNLAFTPATAVVNTGSAVFTGATQIAGGGSTVGGEWAYGRNLPGAPHAASQGISSAGLGLFGNANFSGSNLSGPTAVDGVQYGITSLGDNTATGNTGVTGQPLIKNSVVFRLMFPTGTSASTFNPATSIFNVNFQYGTSLLESNLTPVIPEPGTCVLLATGLAGLYGNRRRRRKQRAATPPTA